MRSGSRLTRTPEYVVKQAWRKYCKSESSACSPSDEDIFRTAFEAGCQVTAERFITVLRGEGDRLAHQSGHSNRGAGRDYEPLS